MGLRCLYLAWKLVEWGSIPASSSNSKGLNVMFATQPAPLGNAFR